MILTKQSLSKPSSRKSGFGPLSLFLFISFSISLFACGSDPSGTLEQESPEEQERGREYNEEQASAALQKQLESLSWNEVVPSAAHQQEVKEAVIAFYEKNSFQPVWNTYKEGGQSAKLLNRLRHLKSEGLQPADFPVKDLQQQLQSLYSNNELDYSNIARLDLLLSANYLLLARQLSEGRIQPGKYYSEWHILPEKPDHVRNLELVAEVGVEKALSKLEPDYRQYELLKEELVAYQQIAARGGWGKIQLQSSLAPGDSAAAVVDIRKRLASETTLRNTKSQVYDKELQNIIQKARYRYGLAKNNTRIDKELVEALNVPVEERIRQLTLNMERSRWLTEPMGDRYVLVNLPEYKLRVIEEGESALEMKVIVGEVVNTTPIFSDSMEYLVFAPYWNVPARIAREEILPYAKKDPSYLERKHFELVEGWEERARVINPYEVDWQAHSLENFPYRVRQTPGAWNSLGLVKFIFPNNKAIYLHDTPADYLFNENERNFSHGCIRVEKPQVLANFLLPDYNEQEVEKLMHLPERKVVQLEEKIPVYIVYFTAVVDKDGILRFLPDTYELDKVQEKGLQSS